MGRLNLQSLIDEVLSMAKEKSGMGRNTWETAADKAEARSRRASEDYYKLHESPDSTTALDRASKLKEREMINAGAEKVANINEAGALARQGLAKTGSENVAKMNLEGTRYTADQGVRSHEIAAKGQVDAATIGAKAKGVVDPSQVSAAKAILDDPSATPEQQNRARKMLNVMAAGNNSAIPGSNAIGEFDKPDNAPSSLTPSPAAPKVPVTGVQPPNQITPVSNNGTSIMDIDRQITEENKKKKYFDNRFGNWAAKRAKNIGMAPFRAAGAGMEGARRILNNIAESKMWDE